MDRNLSATGVDGRLWRFVRNITVFIPRVVFFFAKVTFTEPEGPDLSFRPVMVKPYVLPEQRGTQRTEVHSQRTQRKIFGGT